MIRMVLAFIFLATLGVASNVLFPVEKVQVVGNSQLTVDQVQRLSGLEEGTPWLWAWPQRLRPLEANPWVVSAQLQRPAIGQLRIVLRERTSIANIVVEGQRMGLSADGKFLPNAPQRSPSIEGSGQRSLSNLLTLLRVFPEATRIRYDSSGFRVFAPTFTVWGASVKELQDWAKTKRIGQSEALAMAPSRTETTPASPKAIYVYSWGVSAKQ